MAGIKFGGWFLNHYCKNIGGFKFGGSVRDRHTHTCKYEILGQVEFNLAVAKVDRQIAKFSSPPNFLAIQYKDIIMLCFKVEYCGKVWQVLTEFANYRSVLGKCPWALKHNSQFWPAWALTRDINSICLYGSCNSDPLKFGTRALTRDTTVIDLQYDCNYWQNFNKFS